MNPATMIAIGALIISFFSLIGTIINSVYTAKTYKKNRRLEFLQRKDRLSQKISELNDRVNEANIISARFELVALEKTVLPLRGEQAELQTAQIATIKKLRDGIEDDSKLWNKNIETLHFIYSNLTLETDASVVEKTIAIVQVASNNLKSTNDSFTSCLHTLETTKELMKSILAEADTKIRQINIDFEKAMEEIKVGTK